MLYSIVLLRTKNNDKHYQFSQKKQQQKNIKSKKEKVLQTLAPLDRECFRKEMSGSKMFLPLLDHFFSFFFLIAYFPNSLHASLVLSAAHSAPPSPTQIDYTAPLLLGED